MVLASGGRSTWTDTTPMQRQIDATERPIDATDRQIDDRVYQL